MLVVLLRSLGEIADSVDSLYFVLQNESEFSVTSCSGAGCCCWIVLEIGTFASVRQAHYACFPDLLPCLVVSENLGMCDSAVDN